MKTMAELEAENPDGFRNPVVTDAEYAETLRKMKEKAAQEMLTCPIDNSEPEDDADEEE